MTVLLLRKYETGIKSQMSDNEKIKKADAVIDNSEERADLYESLDEFLREYFFCILNT